jgi:hypothetical protein
MRCEEPHPSRKRVPPGVLRTTLHPGLGLHPPRDPSFASPGEEETPARKSRVRRLRYTSPLSHNQYANKERQQNEEDNRQDDACYKELVDQLHAATAAPSMTASASLLWPPLKLVRVHVAPLSYRLGFALSEERPPPLAQASCGKRLGEGLNKATSGTGLRAR